MRFNIKILTNVKLCSSFVHQFVVLKRWNKVAIKVQVMVLVASPPSATNIFDIYILVFVKRYWIAVCLLKLKLSGSVWNKVAVKVKELSGHLLGGAACQLGDPLRHMLHCQRCLSVHT